MRSITQVPCDRLVVQGTSMLTAEIHSILFASVPPTRKRLPAKALEALAESTLFPMGVVSSGEIRASTPAFDALLGPELLARVVETDRERVKAALATPAEHVRLTFRIEHPSQGPRDLALEGSPFEGGWLVVLADRTEQARTEQQLSCLAFVDALTGLPNRAQFQDELTRASIEARKTERSFALLSIDLDGFKAVNDTHGHDTGDALLMQVATRLSGSARQTDRVARLGGDEFAALLCNLREPEDAAIVAGRIVRAIQRPFDLEGVTCHIGASVGIAIFPSHGEGLEQIVAAADHALYEAKRSGRGCYRFGQLPRSVPTSAPFVRWTTAHELGHRGIDAQHRALAACINELGRRMKAGCDRLELEAAFHTLFRATEKHFAYEEALMKSDEDAIAHRAMHRRLLDDLRSLAVSLDERSVILTMRYLQQWLFRHVDTEDRALVARLCA